MKSCPRCGYLTLNDVDEIITDIFVVYFWQYDEMAQDNPYRVMGANKNYKMLGADNLVAGINIMFLTYQL